MKIKNINLLEGSEFIKSLRHVYSSRDLPIAFSWSFSSIVEEITKLSKKFNEARNELIAKHSVGSEVLTQECEGFDDFVLAHNELCDLETDLNVEMVDLELEGLECSLSSKDMKMMEDIINFVE